MNWIHAIILGIVEGVSEFLPISSTGHMMIASHLMGLEPTPFLKTFEIAIQLGAIAAVAGMYGRVFLLDREIVARIMTAFLPTAIIGLVLYKIIKHVLLAHVWIPVATLGIGGVLLIVFERFLKSHPATVNEIRQIRFAHAFMIGAAQSLAVIPGVSRSAATIISGLCCGVGRKTIVEFSFLLAIPTMLTATVLDLLKTDAPIAPGQWMILLAGFAVSWAVAVLAIRWFIRFIGRFDFTPFGVYRIIVALLMARVLWHQ
jgi:undecaprenyl-diphosphatase